MVKHKLRLPIVLFLLLRMRVVSCDSGKSEQDEKKKELLTKEEKLLKRLQAIIGVNKLKRWAKMQEALQKARSEATPQELDEIIVVLKDNTKELSKDVQKKE